MIIRDIRTPKTELEAFEFWKNRYQAELIPMLSISKKIDVVDLDAVKPNKSQNQFTKCNCDSCVGDFSGASFDEEWGGR